MPQYFPDFLVQGIFSFAHGGGGAQLVSGFLAEGITPGVARYWCALGSRGVQKTPMFLLRLISLLDTFHYLSVPLFTLSVKQM